MAIEVLVMIMTARSEVWCAQRSEHRRLGRRLSVRDPTQRPFEQLTWSPAV